MRKTNLTKEEARELIKYDFESGRAWQQRRDRKWFKTQRAYSTWNTCHAGKEITSDNGNGYYQVILLGEKFLLHRVIWLYVTGEWPKGDIDHINGIKTDNRWENLRDVSHQENARNRKLPNNNTSGEVGIYYNKIVNLWQARINSNNKRTISLGYFSSREEAIEARKVAEIRLGYSNRHGEKMLDKDADP